MNNALAVLNTKYYPVHDGRISGRPPPDLPAHAGHRPTTTATPPGAGRCRSVGRSRRGNGSGESPRPATVQNPTGPGAGDGHAQRSTAIVPVVIPTDVAGERDGPLNFLYSGTDMWFQNSVHVKAPLYVTRDLHLESTAADRRSGAEGRGRPRPLPEEPAEPDRPDGRQRPADRRGPRGAPVLVEGDPDAAHVRADDTPTGTTTRSSRRSTTTSSRRPPPFISYIPKLTCCAPYGGTIAPAGPRRTADNPSNMGFWYQNADLGPFVALHDVDAARRRTSTPRAESDNSINWSATPTHGDQPDARRLLHVQVDGGSTTLGELSWDSADEIADGQGDDLHRRQHHIAPGGTVPGTTARRRSSPRERSG